MVRFLFSFFALALLSPGLKSTPPMRSAPHESVRNPMDLDGIIIELKVVFGRQRPEGECRGFGICDFVLVIKGGISAEGGRVGYASASQTSNGKLKLIFDRHAGMDRETYDAFFSKGHFVFEVETVVPAELCRKLGLPQGYRIRPGKYPVERNGSALTLIL